MTQCGISIYTQHKSKAGILRRDQRHMSIRIARAFRALIFEALLIFVGMITFQLIAGVDAKLEISVQDQCYAGADIGKKHLVRWQHLRRAQEMKRQELLENKAGTSRADDAILPDWDAWLKQEALTLT